MYSTSIMTAIRRQEEAINDCRRTIRELENKLENQNAACTRFDESARRYDYALNSKRNKADAVISHASTSTLAEGFSLRMEEAFNTASKNEKLQRIAEVSGAMNKERAQTENALNNERRRLTNLEAGLDDLYRNYRNALAREAQEREESLRGA